VRTVPPETDITTIHNAAERARRQVGRPSKAEEYRDVLMAALTEEPALRSVELLHRARHAGYTGGKSVITTAQIRQIPSRNLGQARPRSHLEVPSGVGRCEQCPVS
jgi:hypothetical protein